MVYFFASLRTCRHRSLQVVLAPSICNLAVENSGSRYHLKFGKMKSGLELFSVVNPLPPLFQNANRVH